MEFIVTPPECANADCYEIVEVETDLASAETVKAELRRRFSQSWKTPVCVRSYPEVAGDVRASACEMAAACAIFMNRA